MCGPYAGPHPETWSSTQFWYLMCQSLSFTFWQTCTQIKPITKALKHFLHDRYFWKKQVSGVAHDELQLYRRCSGSCHRSLPSRLADTSASSRAVVPGAQSLPWEAIGTDTGGLSRWVSHLEDRDWIKFISVSSLLAEPASYSVNFVDCLRGIRQGIRESISRSWALKP